MADYKIAVISDIHSNCVALAAIVRDVIREGADKIIVAGDIIGGFTQPNEAAELLREVGADVIYGNREGYLREYIAGEHPLWDEYDQMLPITWTNKILSDENKSYLLTLPANLKLDVMDTKIRVVHGSPRKTNELIYKYEHEKIRKIMAVVPEDVLICGHSHQQWHRLVNGTLIVNPGSSGLSFRAGGMAPYTMLHLERGTWRADERQVHYDTAQNKAAFDAAGIAHYKPWANMLMHSIKDGKVATLAFLTYAKKYAISKGWDDDNGLIPNELWREANETFDWENIDFISRAKGPN